jgi:hypothetical protein
MNIRFIEDTAGSIRVRRESHQLGEGDTVLATMEVPDEVGEQIFDDAKEGRRHRKMLAQNFATALKGGRMTTYDPENELMMPFLPTVLEKAVACRNAKE